MYQIQYSDTHTYFVYSARCYPEPSLFVARGQCLRELVVLRRVLGVVRVHVLTVEELELRVVEHRAVIHAAPAVVRVAAAGLALCCRQQQPRYSQSQDRQDVAHHMPRIQVKSRFKY